MIDTFFYDNLIHIIGGLLVIVFSSQIASSAKNVSGTAVLQKLNNPQIFKIVGILWASYGILTFVIPLFF